MTIFSGIMLTYSVNIIGRKAALWPPMTYYHQLAAVLGENLRPLSVWEVRTYFVIVS